MCKKQQQQGMQPDEFPDSPAVEVRDLTFEYPNNYGKPIRALTDISFTLERGSRTILLGANGAGKTSMLKLLAGKHLHEAEAIKTLGKPAFYQTLGLSGISYLGGGWTRTIAFAGTSVPYQADIKVSELMLSLQEEFPKRRDELMEILEIDPEWRMHQVSDGQRRRVQILLGLLRPFRLLLLDEMTVDLDVLARAAFLAYLKKETEERGATIIYATHIFDGMSDWPTHFLMLEQGRMMRCCPYAEIQAEPDFKSLYHFVEAYLRKMHDKRREEARNAVAVKDDTTKPPEPVQPFAPRINSGFTPGRMMGFYK